jgi:tRNA-Thr(GGU) m(6)t(6)A37 methyltransferase TsaA
MKTFEVSPIGLVHSPFKEKFAIPRQPGLVPEARGILELLSPYDDPLAVRGLDGFSHIWVIFLFHETPQQPWKPTVRPPRLGGNDRVGVFASRSPFRANPIGQSVVKLEEVEILSGRARLHIAGIDLLDQTPVLDIKPYLPYSDSITSASAGYAGVPPEKKLRVEFSKRAAIQCVELANEHDVDMQTLIVQLLQNDPRPAYRAEKPGKMEYGFRLYNFDVKCLVVDNAIQVDALEPVRQRSTDRRTGGLK